MTFIQRRAYVPTFLFRQSKILSNCFSNSSYESLCSDAWRHPVVMACFFPRDAWKSRRLTEKGKRQVVFNRRDGYEDMQLQVPCGKCGGCRADRAMSWAIRCYHEASLYPQNCFVTLTYADPAPPKLDPKHLSQFFHDLRHCGEKLRWYACGEYGDKTKRPHYHALIFGRDFLEGAIPIDVERQSYLSEFLTDKWGHGMVDLQRFNMATACYVAGYVTKKIGNEQDEDTFQSMSRGLGYGWLQQHWHEIRNNGFVVIEGRKYPVPPAYLRYSDEKMGGVLDSVKRQRKERFEKQTIEQRIDSYRNSRAKKAYYDQRLQHQKEKQKL